MKILTNLDNVIVASGDIEFGIFDEDFKKWKIQQGESLFYLIDCNFTCVEVSDFPDGILEHKYCYTDENGFYPNPNYVEPYDIEAVVKRLTIENETLKTTIINLETSTVEADLETDLRLSILELGLI